MMNTPECSCSCEVNSISHSFRDKFTTDRVFDLWEETGENPRVHHKNVQTPPGKASRSKDSPATFCLSGNNYNHCSTVPPVTIIHTLNVITQYYSLIEPSVTNYEFMIKYCNDIHGEKVITL